MLDDRMSGETGGFSIPEYFVAGKPVSRILFSS